MNSSPVHIVHLNDTPPDARPIVSIFAGADLSCMRNYLPPRSRFVRAGARNPLHLIKDNRPLGGCKIELDGVLVDALEAIDGEAAAILLLPNDVLGISQASNFEA